MSTTVIYSDNFDRADGPIGADWAAAHGDIATIATNAATVATSGDYSYVVNAAVGQVADGAVECRFVTSGGIVFRSDGGDAHYGRNAYMLWANASVALNLSKVVNGTQTIIGPLAINPTSKLLRVEFLRSRFRVYYDVTAGVWGSGTLGIEVTDTTKATAGVIGITKASAAGTINDFSVWSPPLTGVGARLLTVM